jgi:uncharacterized RDD family membrane protein YckC
MNAERALAGRGRRLVATLLDMVLVPLVAILLMLVTGVLEHASDWSESARPLLRILLLGVASYLLLNGYLLHTRGQTVGKAIMGIAIVSARDGARVPTWKLVGIRALFFPLLYVLPWPGPCLLPLADLLPIFRGARRCLHDIASSSVVVRLPAEPGAPDSAVQQLA